MCKHDHTARARTQLSSHNTTLQISNIQFACCGILILLTFFEQEFVLATGVQFMQYKLKANLVKLS